MTEISQNPQTEQADPSARAGHAEQAEAPITLSGDLQNALFVRLAENSALSALFTLSQKGRTDLPRLDFDALQTRPHPDGNEDLYVHDFSFSLWSDLHDVQGGLALAEKLRDWFDSAALVLTHAELIYLRFDAMHSSKNTRTRYHRHQIHFTALTDSSTT